MQQAEYGTVTSVAPLMVQLYTSDAADPALVLASYTPVVDAQVAVVTLGAQLLILGRVI